MSAGLNLSSKKSRWATAADRMSERATTDITNNDKDGVKVEQVEQDQEW